MPDISRKIDGRKFMWDGNIYSNADEAKDVETGYKKEDFETGIIEENGKYLVYTRKVVTEFVVEGGATL
jgi:hypothetical protein